jgi:membrane-associated phospholipid phosphatase
MSRPNLVIFCCIAFALFSSIAQAEHADDSTPPDSTQVAIVPSPPGQEYLPAWYDMVTNLPGDWVRYSDQTFRTENIPAFLGIAASTTALMVTDDKTWNAAHKWFVGSNFVTESSHTFEWVGDGRPQFGLAGAFALGGFITDNPRALRTSSELVEGILACGGVVQLLKHITGRQSPYVSSQPRGEWVFFPNQVDYAEHVPYYDAFPSGHLSTAMATLTVVAENYPECWWIRPIGYPTLGLLAMSMVNTGIHWYSDYPLALSLGYAFGKLVAHPPEINLSSSATSTGSTSETDLSMTPSMTLHGPGVAFALTF